MPQVNLSLKAIYQVLCQKCQDKIVALVKESMADQAIRDSLEGKGEPEEVKQHA